MAFTKRAFAIAGVLAIVVAFSDEAPAAQVQCPGYFASVAAPAPAARLTPAVRELFTEAERVAVAWVDQVALRQMKSTDVIEGWFSELAARQAQGARLNVLEHSALAYLVQTRLIRGSSSALASAENVLAQSWEHLTGRTQLRTRLTDPLPWRLLVDAPPEVRVFYSTALRGEPERGQRTSPLQILRNYLPRRNDWMPLAGAAAAAVAAFTTTLGPYIAMPAIGIVVSSIAENLAHRFAGHGRGVKLKDPPDPADVWDRTIYDTTVDHAIAHHALSFRESPNVQFANDEERARADELIGTFAGPETLAKVRATRHGMTLTDEEVVRGMVSLAPVHFAISAMFGFDPIIFLELMTTTIAYPGGIRWLHDFSHMSRSEQLAATEHRPILRWYLRSRYAALAAALHQVHHRDQRVNFSFGILLADLLFNTVQLPTMADMARLRRADNVGITWGDNRLTPSGANP